MFFFFNKKLLSISLSLKVTVQIQLFLYQKVTFQTIVNIYVTPDPPLDQNQKVILGEAFTEKKEKTSAKLDQKSCQTQATQNRTTT